MKVSVLIPAYNAGRFIATALQSVGTQTYRDWDLVVVEDGSRDGTQAIVDAFGASSGHAVTYRNLGANCGVGTARNRLLETAKGDLIAFLDADDTWEPSHLQHAVAQITAGADFVVSGIRTFDLTTSATLSTVSPPVTLVQDPVTTLFTTSAIITSSAVVMKNTLAQRVGQFDTTLRIGEDRDYWLRCALEGAKFAVTHSFTCNYAKHSSSSMAHTTHVAEYDVRFYEKYRVLADVPMRLRRELLAKSLVSLGRLVRRNDPQRSASYFWRAWRCKPMNIRIPFHLAFTRWKVIAAAKVA